MPNEKTIETQSHRLPSHNISALRPREELAEATSTTHARDDM